MVVVMTMVVALVPTVHSHMVTPLHLSLLQLLQQSSLHKNVKQFTFLLHISLVFKLSTPISLRLLNTQWHHCAPSFIGGQDLTRSTGTTFPLDKPDKPHTQFFFLMDLTNKNYSKSTMFTICQLLSE